MVSLDSPSPPASVSPISFLPRSSSGHTNAQVAPRANHHISGPQIRLDVDEDDLFGEGPQPGPGDVQLQPGVRGSDEYGYGDWDEAGLLEAAKEAEAPVSWQKGTPG
jgi:hypothetical protein